MKNPTVEQHALSKEGKSLRYGLQRSDRKTLEISVHPEGDVIVTAPHQTTIGTIEEKLKKRLPWIARNLLEVEQQPKQATPRQWVSGETHYYLGRQYRLKIIAHPESSIKLKDGFFYITLPDRSDKTKIQNMMGIWYKSHAQSIFQSRLDVCISSSKAILDVKNVDLVIRKMSQRWGSCTPSGRILLNLNLIKAPIMCIDYIIMHELCHLAVMNHSKQFWRLLSQCMPDWEKRKAKLAIIELDFD
jgi:predicted metal-dependent hydrolase